MTTAEGTPTGTPDETPDETTRTFVLPQDWRNAEVVFTIEVTAGQGDTLEYELRNDIEEFSFRENVEDYFLKAGFTPNLGKYVFRLTYDGLFLDEVPEGTTAHQRRSLVMWLKTVTALQNYFNGYIRDLRAFPSDETINAIARDVVLDLVTAQFGASAVRDIDVVDPRTVRVQGVCSTCGFGFAGRMAQLARDVINDIGRETGNPIPVDMNVLVPGGPSEIDGVRYMVTKNRDGDPIILIGYLEHNNSRFDGLLNNELAQKVTLAIPAVLMDVVTEVTAKLMIQARLVNYMLDGVYETFEVDEVALEAKVVEIDAKLRKDMGIHDEPEDTFENDLDPIGDEPVDEDALSASSVDGTDETDTGTSTDEPESDDEDADDEPEPDDNGAEEPEPDEEVIVSDEAVDGNDDEIDVPIGDPAPEEETSPPSAR